ncbi:MAG: UDP-N-acetylmuramoyl-L-alanyl-D-glutamate--2,6-diaminopimelate ligase [Ruminococcaceae bacterium]|nr:UDP-N-acetylmuramoyl-L-alanyl-D-glutamate--2,6-diaminopimelate ligase [Oscillospiraceae bacterium]
MLLSKLINGIKYFGEFEDTEISSIVTNSKKVTEGALFVAIEGVSVDGHDFIQEAVQNGAVAAVVTKKCDVSCTQLIVEDTRIAIAKLYANFLNNPVEQLSVSGITGTNGKTTTGYLSQYIMSKSGISAGLIGTVENITGEGKEASNYTTPEPVALQQLFKKMVDTEITDVVMEVSSHALAQNRVHGIDFKVGAFTNLTRDHLDYHGTMENYLNEKLKLIDMSEIAVINVDDESAPAFLERAGDKKLITYGIENEARLRAQNIVSRANGSYFTMCFDDKKYNTFIGIPGKFSVYNALCAVAIAIANGVRSDVAAKALKSAPGVCGRMEIVPTNKDFTVIIDYAHTPDGLEKAITTLRDIPKEGKLTVLFGCGGDRDKTKRPMMGKIACELADNIIITSDNPRTEEPNKIIMDILAGVQPEKATQTVIPDRREAIAFALGSAQKGDVILLAGKGHETYQILKDMTIHFDEREVIKEILMKES